MTREQIDPEAEGILFIDGCDKALIGRGERCGQKPIAIYSYDKLVKCFLRDGCDHEGAVEWIDFNIAGAWLGEQTPMILYTPDA